jgi:WD40 repeat protein
VLQQSPTSVYSIETLEDALRFVGRFGSILNKSAIHLYFSALPFTPQGTTLYRVYSARYRDIPRVTLGYPESWPEELCTVRNLNGNKRTRRHLAFSADSSRLCVSTPTHLVTASPLTGVQLGKYRLGLGDPRGAGAAVFEMPLALGCRGVFSNSITSGLLLRIANSRSLKEIQLSLPPISADQLPSIHTQAVTCAAFDREVNTLCVGCSDGRIQLWRLERYRWEPERGGFPYSHSSAVICIAAASELLASISQRELKISPCEDASKHGDVTKETLTLTPRWLAGAHDIGLAFAASSVASWACAVSYQDSTADDHTIHVFTSGDQRGKKIFSSNSSSYPVYALSSDASVLTIICDGILLRLSTVTYGLLGKRTLSGIDSTRLDRFPVISPDGRLLAVCDGDVVHIKDLMQPPLGRPDKISNIKAAGVIMTDKCYVVKGGKEQWLALAHDDGTFEDIAQLREHEIKHLAVSADGTKLAALSLYQGKTQHGILEVANVNSRRRSTTTWPLALHDSFTDWEICGMEFTATGRYIAMVFFLAESSYICACDLENGSLRWKQLPGEMRPLAARSLQGEQLIVVRIRDLWKIDIGNPDNIIKHDLYSRDPSKMATFYAKFTETKGSSLLEIASRLWNKPPRYTIWNTNTIAQVIPEEAKVKRTIAHLEVHNKSSFGHWVLSNVGQRVCCIPEEYSSKWGVKTHSSIGHDRLALLTGDDTVLIVNFQPMMDYLNRTSA